MMRLCKVNFKVPVTLYQVAEFAEFHGCALAHRGAGLWVVSGRK